MQNWVIGPLLRFGLAVVFLRDKLPDPASKDPSIPRAEMLARFRTARDTIRGMLERFAAENGLD